jgi:hypothetical protein
MIPPRKMLDVANWQTQTTYNLNSLGGVEAEEMEETPTMSLSGLYEGD